MKIFHIDLGHGLGISVHEYPSVTGTNELELKNGMVFTIEPGIYNSIAGVRIEDDVVVTDTGVEVLTKYPKELIIIIINKGDENSFSRHLLFIFYASADVDFLPKYASTTRGSSNRLFALPSIIILPVSMT